MLSRRCLLRRLALLAAVLLVTSQAAAQQFFMTPLRLSTGGQSSVTFEKAAALKGVGTQRQSLTQRHNMNLRGVSQGFIGKPWLSSLSVRFDSRFDYRVQDRRSSRGSGPTTRQQQDTWFLNNSFNTRLTLLPGSRLPFDLGLSVGQSVAKQGDESRRYDLSLGQSFSPLSRRSLSVGGRYEWGRTEQVVTTTRQKFSLRANDVVGLNELSSRFEWLDQQQEEDGSGSYSLQGRHVYRASESAFSMTNFVSRIDSQTSEDTQAVINQFSNTMRWSPGLYLGRLDYGGSSRLVSSESRAGGQASEALQLVHDSRVTYRVTPTLTLDGGAAVTYADANKGALTTSEDASLSYSPLQRPWGLWMRQWNASAATAFSQAASQSRERLSASASQRIRRDLDRGGSQRVQLSLSQSVSSQLYNERFEPSYNVAHSVNYYRSSSAGASNSSWQLSFNDSREVDGSRAESQLLSSDYSHSFLLSGGGSLGSDADVELSRALDAEQSESIGVSSNIHVTYKERAVLGIPRLSYSTQGRLDLSKNLKAALGEAEGSRLSWQFTNQLSWRWGLLSLSGSLNFSGTREAADSTLRFEIRRQWQPLR